MQEIIKKENIKKNTKKTYVSPSMKEIAKVKSITKGSHPVGTNPDSEFCTPGLDCTFVS